MAEAQSEGKITKAIAVAKDVFSLLRDSFVFFGLVMLLVFPVALNKILNSAGIVEFNAGFAVWKNSLVTTDAQLKVANDTITSLRATQDKLLAALAVTNAGKPSPAQQSAIAAVRASVQTNDVAARQVQANVQATLRANASLVAKEAPPAATASAPPGICYQERDPRQPPDKLYSVHCHATKAQCDTARGPNAKTVQTQCVAVAVSDAQWSPTHGGFLGAWFEYRAQPFPAPFPQLPAQ
jgi:hypothetical protein